MKLKEGWVGRVQLVVFLKSTNRRRMVNSSNRLWKAPGTMNSNWKICVVDFGERWKYLLIASSEIIAEHQSVDRNDTMNLLLQIQRFFRLIKRTSSKYSIALKFTSIQFKFLHNVSSSKNFLNNFFFQNQKSWHKDNKKSDIVLSCGIYFFMLRKKKLYFLLRVFHIFFFIFFPVFLPSPSFR